MASAYWVLTTYEHWAEAPAQSSHFHFTDESSGLVREQGVYWRVRLIPGEYAPFS